MGRHIKNQKFTNIHKKTQVSTRKLKYPQENSNIHKKTQVSTRKLKTVDGGMRMWLSPVVGAADLIGSVCRSGHQWPYLSVCAVMLAPRTIARRL